MKKTIYFSMVTVIFLNTYLFGSNEISAGELKEHLTENKNTRSSGTGTFIRTIYKKAVSQETLTKGKEFQSDKQKEEYIKHIRQKMGIDVTLKQDELTCTLEKLQYDQNKMRREYATLSGTMANKLLSDVNAINDILLKVCVYDGEKMVLLQNAPRPDGGTVNYGAVDNIKIYFPKFCDYGRIADEESISKLLNSEIMTIRQSVIGKQIHVDLELSDGMVKLKWIFEPDKGMSISYIGLYLDNKLTEDTISQDFVEIADGEWFPMRYISNKYAHINGTDELIYSEMLDPVPGSVQFNTPIDPSVFSLKFPDGTRVTDFRYNPPISYSIELPSLDVFLEPLQFDTKDVNLFGDSVSNQQKGMFVPMSDLMKKQLALFALDLASGKIVSIFDDADTQSKLHRSPFEIGQGDILWDGALLTVRNTKASMVKQEVRYPFVHTANEWYDRYELSKNFNLPYSILLTTRENANYLLSIYKIEKDGIWVTYKSISPNEKLSLLAKPGI